MARPKKVTRDRKVKKLNSVTGPSLTQDQERLNRQLRRWVPDRSNLEYIITEASWRCLFNLSRQKIAWEKVCEDRIIHNARVCCNAKETLQVRCYDKMIVLFDKEQVGYQLPPIPYVRHHCLSDGLPWEYRSAVLDGKLYVMGGMNFFFLRTRVVQYASNCVYVLDLAGYGEWTMCAPMKTARYLFGCCIKEGRIHIHGGENRLKPVQTEEVYDPSLDTWSSMPYSGFYLHSAEKHHQIVI